MAVSILIAAVISTVVFGIKSVLFANQYEFVRATQFLQYSKWTAFLLAVIGTYFILGWPFVESTHTVSENIVKKVPETVQVPVKVSSWYFFTKTVYVDKRIENEVVQRVSHEEQLERLSWIRIAAMIFTGLIALVCQSVIVKALWGHSNILVV